MVPLVSEVGDEGISFLTVSWVPLLTERSLGFKTIRDKPIVTGLSYGPSMSYMSNLDRRPIIRELYGVPRVVSQRPLSPDPVIDPGQTLILK